MDALNALINRVSIPLLEAPGPSQDELTLMFRAALRAPDHGAVRPWRFLVIEGDARERLGELLLKGALADDPELPEEKRQKLLKAPLRAPTLVVVIAATREHPKAPKVEQVVSAGCAAHSILLAAHAQGLGAMWRTGGPAYDPVVRQGLGLGEDDELVGFIYLGTPSRGRSAPEPEIEDFVSRWDGD